MFRKSKEPNLSFEETVADDWAGDLEVVEVPLQNTTLRVLALVVLIFILVIAGRILILNLSDPVFYAARAANNANELDEQEAPRGLITDRSGIVLAENTPVFSTVLDLREFLQDTDDQASTLATIQQLLGISSSDVWNMINQRNQENFSDPIVLNPDTSQDVAVQLKALNLPALQVVDSFQREYPLGPAFASVLGYTSLVSAQDLQAHPDLSSTDQVGQSGIEEEYDQELQGKPGVMVTLHNAQGQVMEQQQQSVPQIGQTIQLTIDSQFQQYFYNRMQQGLQQLGRVSGAALAMNPQNGQILAMFSFPSYDNNIFTHPGNDAAIESVLNDPNEPLFNRVVSGAYSPGSTIKPLDGVAVLTDGVTTPEFTVFSPGYLDIPNPYDPSKPTRYMDWQYQGVVNLASAIAQSSDVYFYEVVGGVPGVPGLGIDRLMTWWKKFNLGNPTGIDFPGEVSGFLPSPTWKQQTENEQWLLGDTYNVAIGQGDLTVTPLQLLDYISAIANGGTLYRPYLNEALQPKVINNLTSLAPAIAQVQQGMRLTVTGPKGTAYTIHDLKFGVWAKTGSAQVKENTEENALFVGYAAPTVNDKPQIALLILIENSIQGSLNTVPIAHDVLQEYYNLRMAPQ